MDDRLTSALCEFAGLELRAEDLARFGERLGDLLDAVEKLFEIDTSEVGPIQELHAEWT